MLPVRLSRPATLILAAALSPQAAALMALPVGAQAVIKVALLLVATLLVMSPFPVERTPPIVLRVPPVVATQQLFVLRTQAPVPMQLQDPSRLRLKATPIALSVLGVSLVAPVQFISLIVVPLIPPVPLQLAQGSRVQIRMILPLVILFAPAIPMAIA